MFLPKYHGAVWVFSLLSVMLCTSSFPAGSAHGEGLVPLLSRDWRSAVGALLEGVPEKPRERV